MPPPLLLDLDIGPFMRGLGDALTLAWLGEGQEETRRQGDRETRRLCFRTSGPRAELLRLFGQTVYERSVDPRAETSEPVNPSDAYLRELADGGRRPRLSYLAEFLGVAPAWRRPSLIPHPSSLISHPAPVLLFPQTHWQPRAWPAAYWVDLAWRLAAEGVETVMLLEHRDKRFENVPRWESGVSLADVIERVAGARLVIANDSFAAHLAGTLQVPTIALCGPSRASCVFGHFDVSVGNALRGVPFVCLSADAPDCVGCHFDGTRGFRAACDQGCQALYRLLPDHVFSECLGLLQY